MKVSDSKHRLMELMETFDINQKELSTKSGVPTSAISMYINGQRVPRQDKIGAIADAFGVDPAWLMGYDVPMERRDNSSAAEKHFEILKKYLMLSPKDQDIINSMMDSMLEKRS